MPEDLPDALPDNFSLPPKEASAFDSTDLGNSDRLVSYYGDRLRYCPTWKEWLTWDKHRWKADDTCRAESFAEQTVRRIVRESSYENDPLHRKAILSWARSSHSSFRLDAMLKRAHHKLVITPGQLDQHPYLLNCLNGTLDLQTFVRRDHSQSDYLTQITSVAFDPQAVCPTWLNFLHLIFGGDTDLIAFIQRALGYTLTGDVNEQVVFVCHGDGGNGKTKLLMAQMGLLFLYGKKTRFETLLISRRDTVGEDIAELFGARMVYAAEPEHGARLNESRVKELASAEPITCRKLYGHPFTYLPTYKVWLHCNEQPRVEDPTHGMWRKVMLIPFNVRISDVVKVDIHFGDRLAAELPGILNWTLQGCREWQRGGLAPPASVLAATEAYRQEQDVFSGFLTDCCQTGPQHTVLSRNLIAAFAEWCGPDALTEKAFSQRLKGAGFTKGHSTKKATAGLTEWTGLRLRGNANAETEVC